MAELTTLRLSEIFPNPDQPRKDFDPLKLAELAESIKTSTSLASEARRMPGGIVAVDQLPPPFVVLSIVPIDPTIHPFNESTKSAAPRSLVTPEL